MARQLLARGAQAPQRIIVTTVLSFFIFFAFPAPSLTTVASGAAALTDAPAATILTAAPAQETFSGTWTAEAKKDLPADRIHFTFRRGNVQNFGTDYALEDFPGLTRAQIFAAAHTPVSFRREREAGTLECEGSFRDGRGAGTWRLVANQTFRSEMRGRGYNLSDEDVFKSVMLNVTTKFVDDLKTIGFDQLPFEDVVKAVIFKVTPQFASEMKSLGFDNLDLEDLVKARIFKVDAEFVREIQAMGLDTKTLEELVKLRIFKITPDFVGAMRTVNFENLTAEELVKLRIFKITPDYVKSLNAAGLSQLSVEDAVRLRIHRVDDDFIRRARASGHTDLNVEDLVRLSIHGKVK